MNAGNPATPVTEHPQNAKKKKNLNWVSTRSISTENQRITTQNDRQTPTHPMIPLSHCHCHSIAHTNHIIQKNAHTKKSQKKKTPKWAPNREFSTDSQLITPQNDRRDPLNPMLPLPPRPSHAPVHPAPRDPLHERREPRDARDRAVVGLDRNVRVDLGQGPGRGCDLGEANVLGPGKWWENGPFSSHWFERG
jgi:hypothetical protein